DELGGVLTRPHDPLLGAQYALLNTGQDGGNPGADIRAVSAWDLQHETSNIVLAIIDTGVSQSHPDLEARLVPGMNFNGGSPSNTDDSWYFSHGTACAGIAGANVNNGIGIAGVCWRASIMPVRV